MTLSPESLLNIWVMEVGHDPLTSATYGFPPYQIRKAVIVRLYAFLVREFDNCMRLILRSGRRIGGVEG